jgi:HEAT repeat protein
MTSTSQSGGTREREILAAIETESLTPMRRVNLILELRGLATGESVAVLRDSLGSSDTRIHVAALRVLAEIGSEEAIDAMISSLLSPDKTAGSWAATLLGKMEARRALPALVARLQEHGEQLGSGRKFSVILALGRMPHRESVSVLAAALRDPDWSARRQAAWALQQIRAPESRIALEVAVSELSWFRGRWARRALRLRQRLDDDGSNPKSR